jgi:flagellar biosynthesis chaperone FliJ
VNWNASKLCKALSAGKMEESRQTLAAMKTEAERVNWLAQAASTVAKKNDQKLALQFLDEARALVSRRAENYQAVRTATTCRARLCRA